MRLFLLAALLAAVSTAQCGAEDAPLTTGEAKHLSHLRQVTSKFPRAGEGYFSPDGKEISFQAYPLGYPFYQIFVQPLAADGKPRMISTGRGRTTCSYFSRDGKSLLFASSHTDPLMEQTEKAARELEAQGGRRRYQWDFDPHMDLYTIGHDGTGLQRLTDAPGYDAEGSYSQDGKQIVFTSSRDGDADLYIMDADGTHVRQITNVDGYDGGPFFSPDDQWIIYRSDRQKEHMLQLFIVSVDGKHEFQLTNTLEQVNWCPYIHPSQKSLVWSGADYTKGPMSANFDLWKMDLTFADGKVTGGEPQRITDHEKADVLPVFSPDGKQLMWTSNRTADGTSQLWIADWKE